MAAFGAADRLALGSFREAFEAVSAGRARAGVVPIENAVGGSVREVYCLLLDHDLEIVERGVNLSKLESRPSRRAAWEYAFWADLDAEASDPGAVAAIAALGSASTTVPVLGSYPQAEPAR